MSVQHSESISASEISSLLSLLHLDLRIIYVKLHVERCNLTAAIDYNAMYSLPFPVFTMIKGYKWEFKFEKRSTVTLSTHLKRAVHDMLLALRDLRGRRSQAKAIPGRSKHASSLALSPTLSI